MQEYFDKYDHFDRLDTNPTIDNPVIVILGLTILELAIGTALFVFLGLIGNAPLSGLFLGIGSSFLVKKYREHLPKGIAPHVLWSIGLPARSGVPRLFRFSRINRLGP